MAGSEPVTESSVRVRTDRLDRLIEMVGELVIGHSMVAQDETVNSGNYLELQRKVSHTDKIVRQVQDLSMSMRMVQLRATIRKIARLVRDLARRREATINFVPIGEDTEIDRNMVDLINDPLVHLVRNAVDHGIEPPHERERNGKPREGTLLLKAYHSGGNVVVEISDDGRGLDRDKIIEKAISKGLIQPGQNMSDTEIINLIFQPGFSTADKVTDISGRGVGLDVVRKAVETLRGRVDVSSEPGKGCTFSVRLPLTMAITDGMLVKVGNQRYILPTVNIDMSFRPNAEALSTIVGRGEVVVFNGKVLPIFRLHRLFNIKNAVEDPTRGLLIIIGEGNQRCALLVDELVGQHQVVAKPLGDGIGKVQGIEGGAILGDGRVGLILDPQGIALLARQTSDLGIPKEVVC
jgi:two-component system chemotaxis sensor kinase CheA